MKVRQIAVNEAVLYALCDDSSVWMYVTDSKTGQGSWAEISLPVRDESAKIESGGFGQQRDQHSG